MLNRVVYVSVKNCQQLPASVRHDDGYAHLLKSFVCQHWPLMHDLRGINERIFHANRDWIVVLVQDRFAQDALESH